MYFMNNMVYTMSNASQQNEVMAYRRDADGMLSFVEAYETGGQGSGEAKVDPLSSQGSIVISKNGQMLFVVNAGNSTISSFCITQRGHLILKDVVSSYGSKPNSIAVFSNLLYVANSSDADEATNITGFHINYDGTLTHLPDSTRPLSTPSAVPACLVFDMCGQHVFVSELSTDQIGVYHVRCDGTLEAGVFHPSSGPAPFGSSVLMNDVVLVSEAKMGAVSSYFARGDEKLYTISNSVLNGEKATCWLSTSKDDCFAYTSNAGSNSISIYAIANGGTLALKTNVVSNPNANAAPIDNCISNDGNNLYVLNGNEGTISVFRVQQNGQLRFLQLFDDTRLPMLGAQGIVAL